MTVRPHCWSQGVKKQRINLHILIHFYKGGLHLDVNSRWMMMSKFSVKCKFSDNKHNILSAFAENPSPPASAHQFRDFSWPACRRWKDKLSPVSPAKTPPNFWSLKGKKSVKRGLVINEQKYIICWLCSSRKEKMTAINIISVGVNCPELTPPKASWQTDGRRGDLQFPPPSWDIYCTVIWSSVLQNWENDIFYRSKVELPWRAPPQRWLLLWYLSVEFPTAYCGININQLKERFLK